MAAKKSLRVGIDQDYPPFEYLNEKGQPSGFDYEVALSVLRVLDIEAKFLHGNWSQINRMLKEGEVDLLAGVYLNPGREDEYEFSLPYIITSHALFYTQSSQLQTLADIKNAPRPKVIVQNNPHITQYILKLNPKARLVFGHSAADCMRLLAADSGSIAIAPEQVGLYYIRKLGLSNVLVTDVRLLPREYSFATRKGDTLLIQLINHGLNLIQKTGEYDVIREKWLINEKGREFPVVLIWIAGLIIGFLLFILLIYFFWNRQLKRRVSEKTRELNLKLIEKERAEQQLTIEKERAEESDRLKSAFLANMSHEIRTPMNAIIGFSELMADEKISNPERKAFYDLVNTNSQILLNLINDIIDIAKIEAKQLEVNREPVRVNTLLNTLFDTYKLELRIRRKEHLSLELELPADDNLFVIADEFRLGQVFTNLVINSIKFTHQGYVRIGYSLEPKCIRFFVRDTGIGIPAEKQGIIFSRFRQVDEGLTRKYDGAGLGLFICQNLVNLMGGQLGLSSVKEKGSEFYFTLPLPGQSEEANLLK